MQKLMTDYADALCSAGVFIAAQMLEPQQATTTVTRRGGSLVIEEGPFAATKVALTGVFVIDVESLLYAGTLGAGLNQSAIVVQRRR